MSDTSQREMTREELVAALSELEARAAFYLNSAQVNARQRDAALAHVDPEKQKILLKYWDIGGESTQVTQTAAGRIQMIQELLDPNDYDEAGNIIGQHEPIITKEQALKLLGFPAEQDPHETYCPKKQNPAWRCEDCEAEARLKSSNGEKDG